MKNGKMINSINTLCACIITPKYIGILPFISGLRSFFSFSFSDVAYHQFIWVLTKEINLFCPKAIQSTLSWSLLVYQ